MLHKKKAESESLEIKSSKLSARKPKTQPKSHKRKLCAFNIVRLARIPISRYKIPKLIGPFESGDTKLHKMRSYSTAQQLPHLREILPLECTLLEDYFAGRAPQNMRTNA